MSIFTDLYQFVWTIYLNIKSYLCSFFTTYFATYFATYFVSVKIKDALNVIGLLGYAVPTATQFITEYLNISESEIQDITKTCMFIKTVDPSDVTMLLYDANGRYTDHSLESEDVEIDINDEIIIIIHGWSSSPTEDWIKQIAIAYQEKGIKNTLAVNWTDIAKQNYLEAASAVKSLGKLVAEWVFYKLLYNNTSALKNLHLVGHSLGAHVSGFIGSSIYNISGNLVGKISGLDVAAPFFEYPVKLPESYRLDKSDASYVGIYHTCGGFCGFLSSIGDQDFYINYGIPFQPGCNHSDIKKTMDSLSCSHIIVQAIFTKTINSKKYVARWCNSPILEFFQECNNNIAIILGDNNNATSLEGDFYIKVDNKKNPM